MNLTCNKYKILLETTKHGNMNRILTEKLLQGYFEPGSIVLRIGLYI